MADDDDDLRFGDVSGGGSEGTGVDMPIVNLMIRAFVILVTAYVLLSVAETLLNIPIPFV